MNALAPMKRTRKTVAPTLQIHLPAEIALAVAIAAEKAGMSAESLVVDILRDVFEPVFAGRGQIAAQAKKVSA